MGGNILAFLLKDIAHNFCNDNQETTQLLHELFEKEDDYLREHSSDHVFGVYKK